ncbi:hypothetical protein C1645_837570 [Glomus cerebriforme]|uniref:Uncharacterized protein n=1 Tax=Glomus cerebriforme TaxID=658196 RepID=A0A397S9S1_9GLOM|nr:hypothetical protein C1645_837570 [Glomus cerebriforme]
MAGAAIIATGGMATPVIGDLVYGDGKLIKTAAYEYDDEFFEVVGDFIEDVGIDSLTSGLFSLRIQTAGLLAAKEIAQNGRISHSFNLGCIAIAHHANNKCMEISYNDCPICEGVL